MRFFYSLIIVILALFFQTALAETSCTPCKNGQRTCRQVMGALQISPGIGPNTITEKCGEPTIDSYCSPCAYKAIQNKGVHNSSVVAYPNNKNKMIFYKILAKKNNDMVEFWCDDDRQKCADVMILCEKRRTENPECLGNPNNAFDQTEQKQDRSRFQFLKGR